MDDKKPEAHHENEIVDLTPDPILRDGYKKPPKPYDEMASGEKERDWSPDFHDHLIPKRKGFISDFVFHTRGVMTPTLASIWSAIFVLQCAIKREAWLAWYPVPLYPNQYIIIIGPAGRVKKTTAINDIGLPILQNFRHYLRNKNIYQMKQITIIKDKSTPEAMITGMLPESKEGSDYYLRDEAGEFLHDEAGKAVRYTKTSEASIILSELSVMLSKKSYADTMIENLLDLYDPRETWEWRREGKGTKVLRNTCVSLVGGTTVDGFRSSIPPAAKGDGFLSRTVLVYVPTTKRSYSMPFLPKGAPNLEEMSKRLAWVVERALGEFTLTPEARSLYDRWYIVYNKKVEDDPSIAGAISRMDINVLKTALLIRANRYEGTPGVIDAEDMMDSIRLVETTYQAVPYLMGQLDDDFILSQVAKAEVYLSRKKAVDRQHFLGAMKMRSDVATVVVNEMVARGEVWVKTPEGARSLVAFGKGGEEYVWIERTGERDGSFESVWDGSCYEDSWKVWLDPESSKASHSVPHEPKKVSTKGRGRIRKHAAKAGSKGKSEKVGRPRLVDSGKPRKESA